MLSAEAGPLVIFGQLPALNGMPQDYNAQAGPSIFYSGVGLIDPRFNYLPGSPPGTPVPNFSQSGSYCVLDQVPSALAADNIAAAQAPVALTPLTLVAATGAGITVGVSVLNPATGAVVTGLLVIDGLPGLVAFGQTDNQAIQCYDPLKAIARNVRITTNADDTAGFYTVAGYDIYGYPMSEKITGVNNTVASGKKAFKYIASITPSGTIASTSCSAGTGDVYGFPIRVDRRAYARITWDNALITATTGFVAAVTTSPATQITGDVRGTYAVQSASDATKRLQVFVDIPVANIGSTTGLFGVTQV